jgi:hypothetical protein
VTYLILAIAALWVLGGASIYLLLSFGAMDDDRLGRVMIATFWPLAVVFLVALLLIEAARSKSA